MPLSINKLVNLIHNKGFFVKSFYKVYGVCAFIEIISSQNADNYMLYIPSKYNFKIPSNLENVYDLKSIDVESENNESDVLKEYAEKPDELDVEGEYQEIYLNNPKLFDGDEDVGKILKNKYKKQIKLKENNTSENIDVKCILRQLNRLKFCVQSVEYKLVLMYKYYLCFLHTYDTLDMFQIQNFPVQDCRTLLVTLDLEMLYNNNDNIALELSQVKRGIEKILDKNHNLHVHNLQNLIDNRESLVEYINSAVVKKSNYSEYVSQFLTLLKRIVDNEQELFKKLKILNSEKSNTLYKDIEYSHKKNKIVTEIKSLQRIKGELIQNIINLQNQSNNISLTIDKILFDNTVLMDRIFKNLSMLSHLCS